MKANPKNNKAHKAKKPMAKTDKKKEAAPYQRFEFPKGNNFWTLRSKHGRDRLFETPKELWEACCEYFQWCIDNPFIEVTPMSIGLGSGMGTGIKMVEKPVLRPFTLQGITSYLDCNVQYFNDFENSLKDKTDDISRDFSLVITRVREIIYNQKFSGAASGFFNSNIIARDLGLTDKAETKHEFDTESKISLQVDGKDINLAKTK